MPVLRMKHYFLIWAVATAGFSSFAQAQPSDENCHNFAGQRLNTPECVAFLKAQQPLSDSECFSSPTCRAESATRAANRRAQREKKELDERQTIDRAQAALDRKAADAAAAVKVRCGDDYKAPRIGMSIERVKSCVTTVKLTGQLNRADGVVSTYEGGNAYFHVMEGRIVSWGKY